VGLERVKGRRKRKGGKLEHDVKLVMDIWDPSCGAMMIKSRTCWSIGPLVSRSRGASPLQHA
jgi:hypothetical protein